jgi:cysteine desulfurase
MTTRRAYLDHAATTPVRPEAREAMAPFLADGFGNPSGAHEESRRARRAVDDAREVVATLLGADLGEVVFTSGGTEADNLAVRGGWTAVSAGSRFPPAIVCTAIEHPAVLHACRALAADRGARLREVPADRFGVVDADALADACTDDVGLVSLMAVNNELGTAQPLGKLAEIVRSRAPRAVLHTDAVQAAPWLDVAELARDFDLVSVSGHKVGGPQGVGALVVRHGAGLVAQTAGGGQERGRRSGTHNVAGIVGMAAALERAQADRAVEGRRVGRLRDRLAEGLLASVGRSAWTGRGDAVPGFCHLRVEGVEAEALVVLLDPAGLAVSAGSACSSGAVEASHVLLAMGFGPADAGSGVRFSLGWTTTAADIDLALAAVPVAVARLRD